MTKAYCLPPGIATRFGLGAVLYRDFVDKPIPGYSEFIVFVRDRHGSQISKATACRMIRELKDVRGEP